MTDVRRDLARLESEGWVEFRAVLDRLALSQMLEPGLTPDWTVKDLLAHLGSWLAETVVILEQIQAGSWSKLERPVDEINADFYEAWKDVDLGSVRAELASSRNRMLQEWFEIDEISPDAEEWFRESGPVHYAEHLPDLLTFADRVSVRP
jgi:hypothetical protein